MVETNLREKSYGVAGGRPRAWLDAQFIPPPAVGERMRHDEGVDGAETKWELAVRAYAALERVMRSDVENQVVVTHGGTATFLVAAWIGMPIEAGSFVNFRFSPGGITLLREDEFFHNRQVALLNDVGHLTCRSQEGRS